ATAITVVVKDAGKSLIQVVDNGQGMSPGDARVCFERHATSKISAAEDLFAIQTMGFRGEALASVAAVAEVTLKTRRKGDEVGTQVRVSGSKIQSQEPVSTPEGTNFMVKNLFFNVPARRKFLKSDQTELRHIINEFNHVALTRQEIECNLIHNDTDIFRLRPGNLRQRITGVFGKAANAYLLPLKTETSLVSITGYIGKPEHARKTYGEQFFFVNNRYIRHPYFHKAVMGAYAQILAPDHIPAYFIFFETDPSRIDVNRHPSKTEIKFEEEKAIWQILLSSVKEAIGRNSLSPSLDFDKEGIIDIPVLSREQEVRPPQIETNPDYNPFEEEQVYRREKIRFGEKGFPEKGFPEKGFPEKGFPEKGFPEKGYPGKDYGKADRLEGWEKLFEPAETLAFPGNKYLHIKNKYVLSPVKSGLMVIDQRRARERILYDRMIDAAERHRPVAQQSMFPETIRLNAADYQVCLEMMDQLEKLGFDIRDFGNQSIVIHGIPADMDPGRTEEKLEWMIEQYKNLQDEPVTGEVERIARAASAAAAIGYGKTLTGIEMQELVDQLFACSNPNYTPSGKPIVKILEMEELDKLFKA
ncbi:MAG TPA: DNA mismatch repair protein MutL, partial [Bacteroides sp.]|nr:DNA mismatch repair protein MutL [Bacteroides sp.]